MAQSRTEKGTLKVKILPFPSVLSTQIVPWLRVIKSLQSSNPKPDPFS